MLPTLLQLLPAAVSKLSVRPLVFFVGLAMIRENHSTFAYYLTVIAVSMTERRTLKPLVVATASSGSGLLQVSVRVP